MAWEPSFESPESLQTFQNAFQTDALRGLPYDLAYAAARTKLRTTGISAIGSRPSVLQCIQHFESELNCKNAAIPNLSQGSCPPNTKVLRFDVIASAIDKKIPKNNDCFHFWQFVTDHVEPLFIFKSVGILVTKQLQQSMSNELFQTNLQMNLDGTTVKDPATSPAKIRLKKMVQDGHTVFDIFDSYSDGKQTTSLCLLGDVLIERIHSLLTQHGSLTFVENGQFVATLDENSVIVSSSLDSNLPDDPIGNPKNNFGEWLSYGLYPGVTLVSPGSLTEKKWLTRFRRAKSNGDTINADLAYGSYLGWWKEEKADKKWLEAVQNVESQVKAVLRHARPDIEDLWHQTTIETYQNAEQLTRDTLDAIVDHFVSCSVRNLIYQVSDLVKNDGVGFDATIFAEKVSFLYANTKENKAIARDDVILAQLLSDDDQKALKKKNKNLPNSVVQVVKDELANFMDFRERVLLPSNVQKVLSYLVRSVREGDTKKLSATKLGEVYDAYLAEIHDSDASSDTTRSSQAARKLSMSVALCQDILEGKADNVPELEQPIKTFWSKQETVTVPNQPSRRRRTRNSVQTFSSSSRFETLRFAPKLSAMIAANDFDTKSVLELFEKVCEYVNEQEEPRGWASDNQVDALLESQALLLNLAGFSPASHFTHSHIEASQLLKFADHYETLIGSKNDDGETKEVEASERKHIPVFQFVPSILEILRREMKYEHKGNKGRDQAISLAIERWQESQSLAEVIHKLYHRTSEDFCNSDLAFMGISYSLVRDMSLNELNKGVDGANALNEHVTLYNQWFVDALYIPAKFVIENKLPSEALTAAANKAAMLLESDIYQSSRKNPFPHIRHTTEQELAFVQGIQKLLVESEEENVWELLFAAVEEVLRNFFLQKSVTKLMYFNMLRHSLVQTRSTLSKANALAQYVNHSFLVEEALPDIETLQAKYHGKWKRFLKQRKSTKQALQMKYHCTPKAVSDTIERCQEFKNVRDSLRGVKKLCRTTTTSVGCLLNRPLDFFVCPLCQRTAFMHQSNIWSSQNDMVLFCHGDTCSLYGDARKKKLHGLTQTRITTAGLQLPESLLKLCSSFADTKEFRDKTDTNDVWLSKRVRQTADLLLAPSNDEHFLLAIGKKQKEYEKKWSPSNAFNILRKCARFKWDTMSKMAESKLPSFYQHFQGSFTYFAPGTFDQFQAKLMTDCHTGSDAVEHELYDWHTRYLAAVAVSSYMLHPVGHLSSSNCTELSLFRAANTLGARTGRTIRRYEQTLDACFNPVATVLDATYQPLYVPICEEKQFGWNDEAVNLNEIEVPTVMGLVDDDAFDFRASPVTYFDRNMQCMIKDSLEVRMSGLSFGSMPTVVFEHTGMALRPSAEAQMIKAVLYHALYIGCDQVFGLPINHNVFGNLQQAVTQHTAEYNAKMHAKKQANKKSAWLSVHEAKEVLYCNNFCGDRGTNYFVELLKNKTTPDRQVLATQYGRIDLQRAPKLQLVTIYGRKDTTVAECYSNNFLSDLIRAACQ